LRLSRTAVLWCSRGVSVVRRVLLALANVAFPGLGFALMSRPRAFGAHLGAVLVAFVLITRSVWCLLLLPLVLLAGAVLAFRDARRFTGPWSWGLGAASIAAGIVLLVVVRLTALEAFALPASSMSPTLQIGDHIYADKLTPQLRAMQPGEIIVFRQPCSGRTFVKRVVARGGQTVEVRCGALYVDGVAVPTKPGAAPCRYPDHATADGELIQVACSEYVEALGDHTYRILHAADYPAHPHEAGYVDFPLADAPPPSCADDPSTRRPRRDEVLGAIVASAAAPADTCAPHLHYVVPAGHLFVMGDNRDNSSDSRIWGAVPEDDVIARVVGIWGPLSRFGDVE
jgi:signal peptidase I